MARHHLKFPTSVVVKRLMLAVVRTSRWQGVSSVMTSLLGVVGRECGGDRSILSKTIAIFVPGRFGVVSNVVSQES
ncbi:hypothetical protein TNCV_2711301 [Trichonephila clavipes]|nr:hypothetical protein TNCV_2711301 [Trichonephila clavipes]